MEQDLVRLNAIGLIVESCWNEIPDHFSHAQLDYSVVMPNHFHGIIVLVGAQHAMPFLDGQVNQFGKLPANSMATIIRSFKSASTRAANQRKGTPGSPLWQRNYFERIIRNEDELFNIREYIHFNPRKWSLDRENPDRHPSEPPEAMPWEPTLE